MFDREQQSILDIKLSLLTLPAAAPRTNVVAPGVLLDTKLSLFSKGFSLLHETWVFVFIEVDADLLNVVCTLGPMNLTYLL
jgi:hypothetical protein